MGQSPLLLSYILIMNLNTISLPTKARPIKLDLFNNENLHAFTHKMTHELWVLRIDGIVRNEWKNASAIRAIRVIRNVTVSSPCLWASLTTYPLFQWYPQSKDILINLSMKWWFSAFNAQGSRLNYSSCTVRSSENKCRSSGGAPAKRKRQDETQFATKIDGFRSFLPPLMNANVLFCRFFLNHTLCWSCYTTKSGRVVGILVASAPLSLRQGDAWGGAP